MINDNQIKALDENELAYLYYSCYTEWSNLNMGYEFNLNILKSFKANAIQSILNKCILDLKDEHKNITMNILNKLEENK